MKIEILGDGCSHCMLMKVRAMQAIADLDLEAELITVIDPEGLAAHHASTLPGLVIDGELVATGGRSLAEIKSLLAARRPTHSRP